jgi:SAM-dependent methyltransferase
MTFDASAYWERRHAKHVGTWRADGLGSVGKLALRKAAAVNALIESVGAKSLLDLGCGDGKMASLYRVKKYVGLDVSASAVAECRERGHEAHVYDPTEPFARTADVAISMDVVFHLIDDDLYYKHLEHLFSAGIKAVGIYSTDHDDDRGLSHVRHRKVTRDIEVEPILRTLPRWPTSQYGPRGSDSLWMVWLK